MNQQMQVSEVIRNWDRDPDVARVDGERTYFILIPDPSELLDKDEFAERMIQSANVAEDGNENPDLFRLTDIN
jgi:hypothetical protein